MGQLAPFTPLFTTGATYTAGAPIAAGASAGGAAAGGLAALGPIAAALAAIGGGVAYGTNKKFRKGSNKLIKKGWESITNPFQHFGDGGVHDTLPISQFLKNGDLDLTRYQGGMLNPLAGKTGLLKRQQPPQQQQQQRQQNQQNQQQPGGVGGLASLFGSQTLPFSGAPLSDPQQRQPAMMFQQDMQEMPMTQGLASLQMQPGALGMSDTLRKLYRQYYQPNVEQMYG